MIEIINDDFSDLGGYDLVYVASPYSKYMWGLDGATKDISLVTGRLILKGLNVYSPIAHTHTIAINSGIDPLDHAIWMKFDEAMMKKSDALLVCQMAGWKESYGVSYEIEYFDKMNRPIYTFDPGFIR